MLVKIAKKTQNWMKPNKLTKKSTYHLSPEKGCSATNYFSIQILVNGEPAVKISSRSKRDQTEATGIMQPELKRPGRDNRKRSTGSE